MVIEPQGGNSGVAAVHVKIASKYSIKIGIDFKKCDRIKRIKIRAALSLPVEGVIVVRPVQLVVDLDPKVFAQVHPLHFLPLDGDRGRSRPVPPVVQLLGLADVALQVVAVAPPPRHL